MISVPHLTISVLTFFVATVFYLAVSENIHADSHASSPPETEASERSENQTVLPPTIRSESESLSIPETQTDTSPKTSAQAEPENDGQEPPTLFYGYWQQGLFIKNPNHHFEMKIGGKIMGDAGYIESSPEIQSAFPGFYGSVSDLRRLSVAFSGTVWQVLDFKTEMDFANVQDIKDQWIRFPTIPIIKYMTFGHIKEPFSLENLSSLNHITFMERSLANEPFAPGRNIGILFDNRAKKDRRLTWAFGGFLNTGSYSTNGDARNQIDQANGYNLSGRVTGLPWYCDEGKHLLHLGLSYNYRNRETVHAEAILQFRTRPESRLTDDRLIDTGEITVRDAHIFAPELAVVSGPFSFQGEFFYALVDAEEALRFWGIYGHASVFLTGESRIYNPSKGIFAAITPHENFEIFRDFSPDEPVQELRPRYGMGAFELGARYSYTDLNDREVKGGKEHNITTGLNWYFKTNIRIMLNYILIAVNDREDPPIENDWAHILQTRFQIHF